jgi:PHD/YefM family antitoxin component YafN of YafNO toxin-antitoxin module
MVPVNEAKQQLQDLIDSVSQSHQPIIIAGQHGNTVLLSETDWAVEVWGDAECGVGVCGGRGGVRAGLS